MKMLPHLPPPRESLHRSLADGGNPEWNTIKKIVDHLGYEVKVVKKRKLDASTQGCTGNDAAY
jgi:hypothetical protein